MPAWIDPQAALHVLLALVLIAVGLPLRDRRIPRNPLYGVRLPVTYSSEDAWYAINSYGGTQLARGGFLLLLIALPMSFWADAGPVLSAALLPVFVLCTLIPLWMTVRFAGRYKRGERAF